MTDLDGMLQDILTVARAVLQTAQELDQFMMNSVLTGFKHGAFPCLADLVVHLAAGLFHHFLDACGMDASIRNQALDSRAGHFAPDRIKG